MPDKEEDKEYTDEELASYWESEARDCIEHDWSSDDYGKYQAAVFERCAAELRDRRPLPEPEFLSSEEIDALSEEDYKALLRGEYAK